MTIPIRLALIDALLAYTAAGTAESPYVTKIPGVTILRADSLKPPMPIIHKPALCLVAQGAKRGLFGEKQVEYRAGQAMVVGIETPALAWVTEASPDEPFLGMVIEFDLTLMRDMVGEIGLTVSSQSSENVFVAEVSEELLLCALRLVRLLERPDAIATIAPLVMRELNYWLLSAPFGGNIASMVVDGQRANGIIAAIRTLRSRFAEATSVNELAREARMSTATFHRQFKMVTSMTPLQYRKQLRLLEARQRMISDGANAETAAYQVGYESQSQFSREYARMFGAPPRRDVATSLRPSADAASLTPE